MTSLAIELSEDEKTLTIRPSPPIEFKGGSIEVLTLQEPIARHVREAEKHLSGDSPIAGRVDYEIKLICLAGGLPAAAGDALGMVLINHAVSFLQAFIETGSPQPGEEEDEADDDPQPETLEIVPPISFAGQTYYEMVLREPLGHELRKARQLMTKATLFESRRGQMHLVSLVTGLPAPVIDAMPISLLNNASRSLARFIVAGRRTGRP